MIYQISLRSHQIEVVLPLDNKKFLLLVVWHFRHICRRKNITSCIGVVFCLSICVPCFALYISKVSRMYAATIRIKMERYRALPLFYILSYEALRKMMSSDRPPVISKSRVCFLRNSSSRYLAVGTCIMSSTNIPWMNQHDEFFPITLHEYSLLAIGHMILIVPHPSLYLRMPSRAAWTVRYSAFNNCKACPAGTGSNHQSGVLIYIYYLLQVHHSRKLAWCQSCRCCIHFCCNCFHIFPFMEHALVDSVIYLRSDMLPSILQHIHDSLQPQNAWEACLVNACRSTFCLLWVTCASA